MKSFLTLIIIAVFFGISSCDKNNKKDKDYSTYLQDNNLCITMPHPTMGVVQPGLIDWRGIHLNDIYEELFEKLVKSNNTGEIYIWVRFEQPFTDKYGNGTMTYDDHMIAIVPMDEAVKYRNGKYLAESYCLSENIKKAAFGDYEEAIKEYNTFNNKNSKENTELHRMQVDYVAPTDTLHLDLWPTNDTPALVITPVAESDILDIF